MATVTLRGPGGKLARVDAPNTGPWAGLNAGWRGLIYDGTDEHDPRYRHERRGSLLIATNGGAIGLDATKYSGGLNSMAYAKPDGDTSQGFAETWKEHRDTSNGATMLVVEYGPGFGGDDGPFFGFPFAVSGGGEGGFLHVTAEHVHDPGAGKDYTIGGLATEDGRPWVMAGYAIHTLISRLARGEDIRPLLREAKGYGANTIQEISCHRSPYKITRGHEYDPRRSDHPQILANLFDICAEEGLRVLHRCFADCQEFNELGIHVDAIPHNEQLQLWAQDNAICRGRWNVFDTLANEAGANGVDVFKFPRPVDMQGVLCSKGNVGIDAVPWLDVWDFAEYSNRRDLSPSLIDANAYQIIYGGWDQNPNGFSVPVINAEPPVFNDTEVDRAGDRGRWTSPTHGRLTGIQIGAVCSGGVFMCAEGMEAYPAGPIAAECARQFFRGIRGAFVR